MSDMQRVNDSTSDHEFDFKAFMLTLFRGKWIISGCTILFTISAVLYAFSIQQWWTSSAVVTNGQYKDTAMLRRQVADLYAIFGSEGIASEQDLDSVFDSKKLLKEYIIQFNAHDNKSEFIRQSVIMNEMVKNEEMGNEQNKRSFTQFWIKQIKSELVDKKNKDVYQLSFQSTMPDISHDLLLSYIKFIDKKVQLEALERLKSTIQYNYQILKSNYSSLEYQAKQQMMLEIIKTDYALDIAISASVKKPIPAMNTNQLFPIDIGSEGLAKKSEILKEVKDLSIFEPKIGIIRTQLELLSKVKIDESSTFSSVRYLKNVDYPINRDSPKRVLIIILGVLLGVISGVVITLINFSLKKKF